MDWDPKALRLPSWLVWLLDALVAVRVPLGNAELAATRAGWVLIGTLIGVWLAAFSSGNNLLYLVGAMLLAFALAQAAAGYRVLARIDPSPVAGTVLIEPGGWRAEVAPLPFPCRALLCPKGAGIAARFVCDGASARWEVEPPQRRCRILWQQALLSTDSPAGLFRWTKPLALEGEWIVPPKARDCTQQQAAAWAEEQFAALRAYRFGDSPRRIHWRRSWGAPEDWVVKQFQGGDETAHTLCVDLRLHGHPAEALERLLGIAWGCVQRGWVRRLCVGAQAVALNGRDLLPAARLLAEARPEERPPACSEGLVLSLKGGQL